jgi:hypothetical protein
VDPSEVAGGELEVVNEEEDARMLELLRAQVHWPVLTTIVSNRKNGLCAV